MMIKMGAMPKTEEERIKEVPHVLEENLKAILAFRKKKLSDEEAGKFLKEKYGIFAGSLFA
jgi:hypothetical protein